MSILGTEPEHSFADLKAIRTTFQWSQEELADELGISVSTLSRWERSKGSFGNMAVSRRHPNRALSYLRAMVEPDLIADIEEADSLRGLFYGDNYILVALSQGMARRYPLARAAVGFPAMRFNRGPVRKWIDANITDIQRIARTPGSGAIWRIPQVDSMIVKDAWTVKYNCVGNFLVTADVDLMKPDEAHLHAEPNAQFYWE